MEIKTFWTIVLKGIGLWFLVNCFYLFPQFLSVVYLNNSHSDQQLEMGSWLAALAVILLYCLIIRLFLFKSAWVIAKLKLDRNFSTQRIDLNMPGPTVLTMVVVIIGGLVFLQGLPTLLQQLIQFSQQKALLKDYGNLSWLVYHFLRTLTGFLLMANGRFVAKVIAKQATKD